MCRSKRALLCAVVFLSGMSAAFSQEEATTEEATTEGATTEGATTEERTTLYPITLTGVTDEDFAGMRRKVIDMWQNSRLVPRGPRGGRARRWENQLISRGIIVARAFSREDGLIEERTVGLVNVPFENFQEIIPPNEWGTNLVDYLGGEVSPLGENRQCERMVLKALFKNLDMTKIEEIWTRINADGRPIGKIVMWKVMKSDNGSVETDFGSVSFERFDEGRTKVTFHSAHKLSTFPFNNRWVPGFIKSFLLRLVLKDYFVRAISNYRSIAEDSYRSGRGILDALQNVFEE